MCNAKDIRRSDGTWVDMAKEPTWREEFHELLDTFRTETYVLWLFPMFFTSNLFYPYQFNGVNQAHLDVRARALNNFVYWIGQILGAMSVGYFVDNTRFYRATKAKLIWLALVVFTMAIWGGGYAWQLFQPDRPRGSPVGLPVIDWSEKPSTTYAASVILYILYGFYDGFWQVSVYWYVSTYSLLLIVLKMLTFGTGSWVHSHAQFASQPTLLVSTRESSPQGQLCCGEWMV
jgi:hypothetical protein